MNFKSYLNKKCGNDVLKHKLVKILTEPLLDYYENDNVFDGKSFEDLEIALHIDKRKLWEVASELLDNKEISFYSVDFEGFIGNDRGLSSYTSKKYLYRSRDRKRESIKFYVSILIPTISLLIALFTVIAKVNNSNERIDKIETKVNNLNRIKK